MIRDYEKIQASSSTFFIQMIIRDRSLALERSVEYLHNECTCLNSSTFAKPLAISVAFF